MNFKKELISIIIILFSVIGFFYPLWPYSEKIFTHPDLGGSDILDFNFPIRVEYGNNLKENKILLWSKDIGMGFPIFAEGQVGTFNITNLIAYKIFSPLVAFNLVYIITFLTTGIGTYFFLRNKKISVVPSLFSALTFTFSGFFVATLNHINFIQSISFLPWIFFFTDKIIKKPDWKKTVLLSVIISQQILTGFPQASFITLLGILFYIILLTIFDRKILKSWPFLICALFLSISLSAIQILPSKEFIEKSGRNGGLSYNAVTVYPFTLKNFLTFFDPFYLGSPSDGSFKFTLINSEGIFWENALYIGLLPLLFSTIIIIKKNRNKYIKTLIIIALLAILLMLGKKSPLYLIFTIPPFNYFRVPSRFLILLIWSLTILSAFGLQYLITKFSFIKKSLILKIFLFVFLYWNLVYNFGFTMLQPAKTAKPWINNIEMANFIKKLSSGRVEIILHNEVWQKEFLKKGWNSYDKYLFYQNFIKPNSNLTFGISSSNIYAGALTNRYASFMTLNQVIELNKDNTITLSKEYLKTMSMRGSRYIISPLKINNQELKPLYNISREKETIYLYENKDAYPVIRSVSKVDYVNSLEEITKILLSEKFNPKNEVCLEEKIPNTLSKNTKPKIEIKKFENRNIIFNVNSPGSTLIVINQSYYPGWKAFIDGKEKPILAANLNEQALFVQKGKHHIEIVYNPSSYKIGSLITIISFFVLSGLLLIKIKDREAE